MPKQDKRLASMQSAAKSRPGTFKESLTVAPAPIETGLDLSDVLLQPLDWFRLNDANDVFRALKKPEYFEALERDINTAGQIIEPILAMKDGLILSGESRYLVAKKLHDNGIEGFARLPVRMVLSPMSPEEQERRLILANLSRFEVPPDVRRVLYLKIWPELASTDTVSVGKTEAVRNLAEAEGISERQAFRVADDLAKASEAAKGEGRAVAPEDVAKAREAKNAERRKPSAKVESPAIVRVRQVAEKLRVKADEYKQSSEHYHNGLEDAYREAADMIEEALR